MQHKKTLFIFFLFVAIENMAANFAHPITPTLIQNLNLPDYSFGVLYAGMAFTNFLFSPMWAKQVKRWGSKNVLAICCVGYGIGQVLFSIMTTLETILMARMLAGFFVGGIMVSFLTYIIHVCEENTRGRYLALSATFASVFGAFGYMVGGFVGVYSIGFTFMLQSFTLIACGIGFYLCMQDDHQENSESFSLLKDANPFQAFIDAKYFMSIAFAILFVSVFLSSTAVTAYDQCFNYYIKDQFMLNSSYNGMVKAVMGFISLFANTTICVWLMNKTNLRKTSIVVMASGMLFLTGIAFFEEMLPFVIVNLLFFIVHAIYVPILQDLCAQASDANNRGMVMGFYNAMKSLGMIAGALFAGFLYEISAKLSFVFASLLFLICTICLCIYYKKTSSL